MLKYSKSEREIGSSDNHENLFVHRFNKNLASDWSTNLRTSMPSMFWRSPYAGDRASSAGTTRKMCMKPVISIMPTKYKQNMSVDDMSKLTVKSILKHRLSSENEEQPIKVENKVNIKNEPSPNLITTGNGTVRPHGSPIRSKTAGKRVQFNSVAKQTLIPSEKSPRSRFQGRRLYLDRSTSTRILGTSARSLNRPNTANSAHTSSSAVNGADTNIKSQINEFIRKLRLAEIEKQAEIRSELNLVAKPNESQRKTAAKLRKSRSFAGASNYPDWSEYDMDKISSVDIPRNDTEDENNDDVDLGPFLVYDAKSRSVSAESMSIESLNSAADDNTPALQKSSGTTISRPKSNVALNTKYRHITTNYVNKYGRELYKREKEINTKRENGSVNFCDTNKTSQILGWLEEVRDAQNNQHPVETDMINAESSEKVE